MKKYIHTLLPLIFIFILSGCNSPSPQAQKSLQNEKQITHELLQSTMDKASSNSPCETKMVDGKEEINDTPFNFPCYWNQKDSVYYYDSPYHSKEKVVEADPNSFTIIQKGSVYYPDSYAKDNTHVYHKDHVLEGADPKTFQLINPGAHQAWFKDKNSIYYFGKKVEEADPVTFQLILGTFHVYAKDKNAIYTNSSVNGPDAKKLPNSDPGTFEILKVWAEGNQTWYDGHAKDINNVYCRGITLPGADPATFQFLEKNHYAKDKNGVYDMSICKKLENADPESFEFIYMTKDNNYSPYKKDSDTVYYHSTELLNSDPATFQFLEDDYAKDKNQVYHRDHILEGADAASFVTLHFYWAKDKNTAYFEGKKVEGSDSETFTMLSSDYAKDKNAVYYHDKKKEGADPKTFQP